MSTDTKKPLPEIGAIILPYTSTLPMITYDQVHKDKNEDVFIRAKYNAAMGIWFSDCEENPTNQPKQVMRSTAGLIVFVPKVIEAGEAVKIARLLPTGAAAFGTVLALPKNFQTPYEYELAKLQNYKGSE